MKNWLVFFCAIIGFLACKRDEPDPTLVTSEEARVKLVFPLKNSECNVGADSAGAVSTIKFEWRSEEETDEYQLNITNLFTSENSTFSTAGDTLSVILPRATPYSWFVVAHSATNDTSEVWKFYNSGDGIASYTPFPADIIFPRMSETVSAPSGSITLEWLGSDVDNDIASFNVFFGLTSPPPLVAEEVTQSELPGVSVSPGNIYYWSVTTRDEHGHEAESGVYQFKVE